MEPASQESDRRLQAEVDRLRESIRDTKELYRAVAAAMFFRFQLVPTANRMHVLVGKGSMTTASAALNRFWQDVRRAARPAIEHPDLPPELARSAGDLVVRLWSMAREAAATAAPLAPAVEAAAPDEGPGRGTTGAAAADLLDELRRIRSDLLAGSPDDRGRKS